MRRALSLLGTLALLVGTTAFSSTAAWADVESRADLRQSINDMESRSAHLPSWFQPDLHLRQLHQADCVDHPMRKSAEEHWYRSDGASTGILSNQQRPKDGAYATTRLRTALAGGN